MDFFQVKKQDFINWIKHPESLNTDSLSAIMEYYHQYPFSPVIGFLLLKNLKNLDHPLFDKYLHRVSSSAPDRVVLYHYLNSETKTTSHTPELKVETSTKAPLEIFKDGPQNMEDLEKNYIQESVNQDFFSYAKPEKKDPLKTMPLSDEDSDTAQPFTSWLEKLSKQVILKDLQKKERIESFVEQNKSRKSFYSAAEMAQKSLSEDDSLVTETLAQIYVMQKNYIKAIQAYEKLSLLFPEKKPYFAGKINEINALK